jgi:hypothetical protein
MRQARAGRRTEEEDRRTTGLEKIDRLSRRFRGIRKVGENPGRDYEVEAFSNIREVRYVTNAEIDPAVLSDLRPQTVEHWLARIDSNVTLESDPESMKPVEIDAGSGPKLENVRTFADPCDAQPVERPL